MIGKLRLLIFVRGNAFQPAQRRDHGQQQMQFRVLGHLRLDKQRGTPG